MISIPRKTLTSGFSLPVLGFGTWQMGGEIRENPKNDDEGDIEAIRRALDAGMTHIDTAELYASGHAEELVAGAIKGRDRAGLQIVSKAWFSHFKPDDLRRACETSLERLQTDYLDMYLLHRFNAHVPLRDTFKAMDRLVDDGLVRNIGVSNFNTEHLNEARQIASHPIVCNQVHYNLIFREPERDGLVRYCQENDVLLSAWRPVELGELAEQTPPILREISDRVKKTPVQVAINWLLSQPNVISLFQTHSPAHLNENLGALGWSLSADDIERLRHDYPGQRDVSDTVRLG